MQIIIISVLLMPFANFLTTNFPTTWGLVARTLFYPVLFFILGFFIDVNLLGFEFYHLSSYALIPACFLIILAADYVIRFLDGGYDKVGANWGDIFLAITLFLSIFPLCFLMFFATQYENNLAGLGLIQNLQVVQNIGFVLFCLLMTVLLHFFLMFLFDIYRKKR